MNAAASTIPEPHEPRAARLTLLRPRRLIAQLAGSASARSDVTNGVLSLFDQGIVSATSFFTSIVIGRLCSQDALGVYYLALSFVLIARGLQEQLILAPYVVYSQSRQGASQFLYTGSALLHFLAISLVFLVVQCAMLTLMGIGIGPGNLAPAMGILLGVLPLLQLREMVRRVSVAHLRIATAVIIDAVIAVLQVAGLLLLAYFNYLTIPLVYLVMGLACAIACAGWLFAMRASIKFSWPAAVKDWSHNFGFARWALASHVIGFATPALMPYFLAALRGSAEAGILAACIGIVGISNTFMTGLAGFLYPRAARAFAQGGIAALLRVLRMATLVYALVLGGFAVLNLVAGDSLLNLVFGEKYAGYGATLGILSLAMFAQSMGLTPGIGLWSIERPRANLGADVSILLVTIILAVCLIPFYGVLGAAWAELGGKTTGAVVRFLTFRRLSKDFTGLAEG